jgi:hypothetical protein
MFRQLVKTLTLGISSWFERMIHRSGDSACADRALTTDRGDQGGDRFLDAAPCCIQLNIGPDVERVATGEDRAQIVHRAAVVLHRPQVALVDDSLHVCLRCRFYPNRQAGIEQPLKRGGFGDDPAAGRDHHPRIRFDHAVQHAAL